MGIEPEIMPRLSSRFAFKLSEASGLRLFISKYVKVHGGIMWIICDIFVFDKDTIVKIASHVSTNQKKEVSIGY